MGKEWIGRKASSKADCRKQTAAAPGCMGGVLHYLHFHHLLFAGDASCCTAPFASPPPPPSSSSSSLPLHQPTGKYIYLIVFGVSKVADPSWYVCVSGFEAPRNSLELDEKKAEEFKEIPVSSFKEHLHFDLDLI